MLGTTASTSLGASPSAPPPSSQRDDLGVVGGGVREGRARQRVSRGVTERPGRHDLVEDRVVLIGTGEDPHVLVVLRRGAHHRGTADVDQLDRRVRVERIEVAHHEVDGRDVVGREGREVLGLRAVGEDAGVQSRVQGLHAAVEHLGETGHVGDLQVRDARGAERRGGAARGDEFDAVRGESRREFDQPGLVPDAQ